MRSFLNFLRDDKGSQSFEFLLWVPIFVALLIIVMDATTLYISQTEMENVARDTARRIVKGLPPDLARANALNSMSLRDLPYSVVATFDPAIGADVTIALQSGDKSYLAYANTLMILGTTIGARVHTASTRPLAMRCQSPSQSASARLYSSVCFSNLSWARPSSPPRP